MGQQVFTPRISVTVKGDKTVCHIHMVAAVSVTRNNPFTVKTIKRRRVEEHARQNVTGCKTEKDRVRLLPPFLRAILAAGLGPIHGKCATLAGFLFHLDLARCPQVQDRLIIRPMLTIRA